MITTKKKMKIYAKVNRRFFVAEKKNYVRSTNDVQELNVCDSDKDSYCFGCVRYIVLLKFIEHRVTLKKPVIALFFIGCPKTVLSQPATRGFNFVFQQRNKNLFAHDSHLAGYCFFRWLTDGAANRCCVVFGLKTAFCR